MNLVRTILVMSILALCLAPVAGAYDVDKVKVGDVRSFSAESKHPYDRGDVDRPMVHTDYVSSPGAKFIRVHFSAFDLAEGDFVSVAGVDGAQYWTYTLKGLHGNGKFWSFAVDGDTAVVRLHAGLKPGYGYRVDKVGHGSKSISPTPEVVCGTDGREDIACHNEANTPQKAVARLLFTVGGSQYVCTGWLVAGSNSSTMLTNNHCFSTQTATNTVQAMFNYQKTTCGGSTNATTTVYAGGTFLKTNSERKKGSKGGLDYTIFTLQGNPESTWGELTATSKAPAVNETIWFIQHPGGNQKRIGFWEDAAHTTRCKVNTINATYGSAATGSQMGYGCDSEGGSSGSPIINEATGRAFGLHHYGGVASCLNSATMMSKVCADAGSLLSCAGN